MKYHDSSYLYGSGLPLEPERPAKSIASSVALGDSYYGSVRRLAEPAPPADVYGTKERENASDEPLPLQLFISSLSEALSYASYDTTATTDFRYPGFGSNVTPMGSTTKLISADTQSTFGFGCFGSKCFPTFGTLFMTISLTASLGNILRLPTIVYFHGGGSFLVAYVCIALLLGVPLIFLEITLGQFCQQGTTKLWRAVPLFKGVGVVKLFSCIILSLYYPIIIVHGVLYSIWTVAQPLPTSQCYTKLLPRFLSNVHDKSLSDSGVNHKMCSRESIFGISMNDDIGWFGIEVCLLLFVWLVIMLCLFRSAQSYRLSSCIVVPITLFIGITLFSEGVQRNTKGLIYLAKIRWESLLSFDLWYAALVQFFLSTHVGLGNITTCAGRLYPKNNPFWTAVLYTVISLGVGIGFVCVVYMWTEDLILSGNVIRMPETTELFVISLIYDVMSQCYGTFGQVWALLAYIFIISAGLCSMMALVYTIIVGISVETKNKWNWVHITLVICGICFIAGCCCMIPESFNIMHLFDHHVIGKLIITSTVLEVFGFVWVYGLKALANDFEFVLGYKLNFIWKALWFSSPFFLSVMEVWSWFSSAFENSHATDDTFLVSIAGWIIYIFAWTIMVSIALWQVFSQVDYNLSQKFAASIKPSRNWGPVDPIYRHCWVQWKKQYQATGEKDFTLRRRGTRDYTHSVKRNRHAGPVGMRYSVNPPSNQNTLQYKMENTYPTISSVWSNSEFSDYGKPVN